MKPQEFYLTIEQLNKAVQSCLVQENTYCIFITISSQMLYLLKKNEIHKEYQVSTAKNGQGNKINSFQTPSGVLRICQKFGTNAPIYTQFKARKSTGEKALIETKPQSTGLDMITSRILWLEGLEENKNKGGSVDTKERFIYIHGTNEEGLIGQAVSHGCIRMKNQDIIELYNLIEEQSLVYIV